MQTATHPPNIQKALAKIDSNLAAYKSAIAVTVNDSAGCAAHPGWEVDLAGWRDNVNMLQEIRDAITDN